MDSHKLFLLCNEVSSCQLALIKWSNNYIKEKLYVNKSMKFKIKWQESLLYFLQMQTKFAELSVKDEEFSPKFSSSVWWALGLQVVTCIRLSTGGSVVFPSFRYKLENFLKFFCMKRMWISSRLFMSAKPMFCWRLSAQ